MGWLHDSENTTLFERARAEERVLISADTDFPMKRRKTLRRLIMVYN